MPIVDRLEYPKKYKLKGSILLLVILLAVAGILYQRYSNKARAERIPIHSVGVHDFDENYIRISYELENKGDKREEVDLLAKVFDSEGKELASILFRTSIDAHTRKFQAKHIDNLARSLQPGEQPHKVSISLHQRSILGN